MARLIDEHEPVAVIGVLWEIADLVEQAVAKSKRHNTPRRWLRFPYWDDTHAQALYKDGLRDVLDEFGCD